MLQRTSSSKGGAGGRGTVAGRRYTRKWPEAGSRNQSPQPVDRRRLRGACMEGRRNWLIVFNCTNIGLANSLKLQAPDLEVESIDFGRFRKDFAAYSRRLATFDLIVTAPHFVRNDCVDFSEVAPVRTMPVPYFDAYHPDLCYVTLDKHILKGPLGDYHSKIITAAFKKRLSRASVRALFAARHYEAFGYFERWAPARQSLLAGFS